MLVDKYVLVVTFFVFISKTAQSFILLTANVADIKKIAQKFVSEDMADKLAHTVVKVIDNLNQNKEPNFDDESNKVQYTTQNHDELFKNRIQYTAQNHDELFKNQKFERNDQFNIPLHKNDQQRFKKATRTDEDFTFNDSQDNTQSIYKEEPKKRTTKYLNNWEINLKSKSDEEKLPSTEEPIAEMKSVSHQQRQKYPIRTTKKPVEYIIRTTRNNVHNYESNEIKSRYVPDLKPILSPESIQRNKKLFDNNPSPDRMRQKQRNHYELKNADDEEHINNIRPPIKPQASENQETEKVTTKRERSEFDQYDNLNYPKVGKYIATSGPVVLPPRPLEKQWWEKDLPDRRKNEK